MFIPNSTERKKGQGFTLLEVLVSITVSSVLLGLLFYLLSFTLDQWRSQTDGQVSSVEARSALGYLEEDLKAIVIKNSNAAEWLRVENIQVEDIGAMPWLTFLTLPTDADKNGGGDVCAVSYRIAKQSAFTQHEPVHGLYRMVIPPDETAEFVGTNDMNADLWASRKEEAVELDRFLAGYVVDFELIFTMRDPDGDIHVLEANEEIRAARDVTVGTPANPDDSIPEGSVLASVEIRMTLIDRGAQQRLNSQAMSLADIVKRYGRTFSTFVEFPHPSF